MDGNDDDNDADRDEKSVYYLVQGVVNFGC